MSKDQVFAAIKIDIVNSRKYENREQLQEKLLRLTNEESNQRFSNFIVSKFVVTHGDELQGLLEIGEGLMDVVNFFLDELYPVKIRIGIGIGPLNTELQPQAIGMDGPAFYNAKDAIDYAHKENKVIVIRGNNHLQFQVLNTILDLMMAIRQDWSEKQYMAIKYVRNGYPQEKIGEILHLTQSAVSKNVKKAKWKVLYESEKTVRVLLSRLQHETMT